jgi:hypothetical protein
MTREDMYRQALEFAANDPGVPARVRSVCQIALGASDEPTSRRILPGMANACMHNVPLSEPCDYCESAFRVRDLSLNRT